MANKTITMTMTKIYKIVIHLPLLTYTPLGKYINLSGALNHNTYVPAPPDALQSQLASEIFIAHKNNHVKHDINQPILSH